MAKQYRITPDALQAGVRAWSRKHFDEADFDFRDHLDKAAQELRELDRAETRCIALDLDFQAAEWEHERRAKEAGAEGADVMFAVIAYLDRRGVDWYGALLEKSAIVFDRSRARVRRNAK